MTPDRRAETADGLRARVVRSRGRLHELRAELSQDGEVRAEASAKFLEDQAVRRLRTTVSGR